MSTGITMTVTSISAMVVMFITATIFGIGLLAEMGFVLAVGLSMDLINTYLMNVSLLRWYTGMGDSL
jgi:preprotein translocase subunit SecF